MITLIKYPQDQAQKQKVYRAVNKALYTDALQKDVSVVLETDKRTAVDLLEVCKENDAEIEIIDTEAQADPKLQAKLDIQSKLLYWIVDHNRKIVEDAVMSLDLTKEELQEAFA